MVFYNASTRELTAKIVYYGPGLGGKTTNLQVLHRRLEPGTAGDLLALSTETDRTIYFDLLPVELGDIKGYTIRFQLATVPGQTAYNETRRVVLKGADGVVFVADSQWTMLPKNLESWQSLKENLAANSLDIAAVPVVIQYNKRDLPDILSVPAMEEALGFSGYPHVEAVASEGAGVTETFKLISKLTFVDLLRRLQARPPSEGAAAVVAGDPEIAGGGGAEKTEARPPLTLVRSLAANEAPPEAPEAAPPAVSDELEPPFAEEEAPADVPAETANRIADLEARLEETRGALAARLDAVEKRAAAAETAASSGPSRLVELRDEVFRELAAVEDRLEERVREVQQRLEQQKAAFARELGALETSLVAKLAESAREPGTIPLALAPLLEEHVRREADENWTAEIERLRQALAESLDDLSERVRKAVRG
ncbi:MAG TPA: ADP-ribosylation factor-like protein [Thermoanaerobaculia bacterium]|nr:ADP-ribosylation factor-like protein [Thermoanaerobaculia bacterium]